MQHSRQSTSRTRPSGAAAERTSDAQRKTAQRDAITGSPRAVAQRAMISEVFGRTAQREPLPEEELKQAKLDPLQRKESPSPAASGENRTGLPDGLKSGIESLSGMSMDHVVNDEASLEQEADVMGAKALSGAAQLRRELAPASTSGAAVQRRIIPGTTIDVSNATNMPTWDQAGSTWHINTTTDTHHVTKEGVPKVQYFFTGTGLDIEDKRPTKKEQGGSSKKKKRVRGEKKITVKTKCVFSELPQEVQEFVRNHYAEIFPPRS